MADPSSKEKITSINSTSFSTSSEHQVTVLSVGSVVPGYVLPLPPSSRKLTPNPSPFLHLQAQDYIRSLPYKTGVPFVQLFPTANPLALDLLEKLLEFDPTERISCEDALTHPYLAVWHEPSDEPVCERLFDFGFEKEESAEGMKRLIVKEVEEFRKMVSVFLGLSSLVCRLRGRFWKLIRLFCVG